MTEPENWFLKYAQEVVHYLHLASGKRYLVQSGRGGNNRPRARTREQRGKKHKSAEISHCTFASAQVGVRKKVNGSWRLWLNCIRMPRLEAARGSKKLDYVFAVAGNHRSSISMPSTAVQPLESFRLWNALQPNLPCSNYFCPRLYACVFWLWSFT